MDLQYPIGKYQWGGAITDEQRQQFIAQIEKAPAQLRQAVTGLTAGAGGHPLSAGGLDGAASGAPSPR